VRFQSASQAQKNRWIAIRLGAQRFRVNRASWPQFLQLHTKSGSDGQATCPQLLQTIRASASLIMARNFPPSAQYGHRVRAFALIPETLRPSSESSVMCDISFGSFSSLFLISRSCLPSSSKVLVSSLEWARTFSASGDYRRQWLAHLVRSWCTREAQG
jgi:hypothetical protein